ncbi:DUF3224 domain-containing protein [Lentzea sp. NPDC051208]|uniref:DUF3224 domain-containing protein n=1 Tax=Lentzea sp. NPDC051208 TaxID=3154642 RepID=UPI00343E382E
MRAMRSLALVPVAIMLTLSGSAAAGGPAVRYAEGGFDVTSYTSTPYKQLPDGASLSHLSIVDRFHGDIQGHATAEAELFSRADGSTRDTGFIHVQGTLAGRSGGFVIETAGSFDGKNVSSVWTIVPGSGSGELKGLRGKGTETAEKIGEEFVAKYRLGYYFE